MITKFVEITENAVNIDVKEAMKIYQLHTLVLSEWLHRAGKMQYMQEMYQQPMKSNNLGKLNTRNGQIFLFSPQLHTIIFLDWVAAPQNALTATAY